MSVCVCARWGPWKQRCVCFWAVGLCGCFGCSGRMLLILAMFCICGRDWKMQLKRILLESEHHSSDWWETYCSFEWTNQLCVCSFRQKRMNPKELNNRQMFNTYRMRWHTARCHQSEEWMLEQSRGWSSSSTEQSQRRGCTLLLLWLLADRHGCLQRLRPRRWCSQTVGRLMFPHHCCWPSSCRLFSSVSVSLCA